MPRQGETRYFWQSILSAFCRMDDLIYIRPFTRGFERRSRN